MSIITPIKNFMIIVLVVLALFGAAPLMIILYKQNRVKRIIRTGSSARARIYEIQTTRVEPRDLVYYYYQTGYNSCQYTGVLTSPVGKYRKGQVLDVFYLSDNPKQHTVKGAWKASGILLVLATAFALFVLVMVCKLYQEL